MDDACLASTEDADTSWKGQHLVDHKWQGLTSEDGTMDVRKYICNVQAHEHQEQNNDYGVEVLMASVQ